MNCHEIHLVDLGVQFKSPGVLTPSHKKVESQNAVR